MDVETKSFKGSAENVPIYRCEICDETFTLYKNLEYHVGTIHENKETPKILQCKTCDKCFTKILLLKRHEDVVHKGLYKFKCYECEKSFSSKVFLQNHFDAIHNDRKYMCDNCDKTFGSKKQLARHQKIHSEKIETVECELCNKKFSKGVSYHNHFKIVHKKDKYHDS